MKGKCYYCNKELTERTVKKHIKTCEERLLSIDKSIKESKKTKSQYIMSIVYKYSKEYCLYIAIDKDIELRALDKFLRDVWLECCGHLSEFIIHEEHYDSSPDEDCFFDVQSMDIKIGEVLEVGDKFKHNYDFGSTTELILEVLDEYEVGEDYSHIQILARNRDVRHKCSSCNSEAEYFDYEENEFFCHECVDQDIIDELEELTYSNSPRDGVCGYYGSYDSEESYLPGNKTKFEKGKDQKATSKFIDDEDYYDYDDDDEFDEDFEEEFIEFMAKKRETHRRNLINRVSKGKFTEDLKELLECNTKENLTTMGNILGIPKISSLNKAKLIVKLSEEYQSKVGEFLQVLDLERYEFLKTVANKGVIKGEEFQNIFIEYYMECGLIFPFLKEDEVYFIMPNEAREEIKNFNDIDNINLLKENTDLIKLCWGMTQYYGGFLLDKFIVMANDYYQFNWNKIRVDEVLNHGSLYYLKFELMGNICTNIALSDMDTMVDIVYNNKSDLPYCNISQKEFMEACNERYIVENKINSDLRKYLKRHWEVEDEVLDMFMVDLYVDSQQREPQDIIEDVMNEFDLDGGPIFNGLLKELNAVLNNTRLWRLKGHTLNQINNDSKENVEVGRNDSCPCGSGKKYKNCCASNVISLF